MMKKFFKSAGLLIVTLLLALISVSPTAFASKRTTIVFWYEMSGPSAKEIEKLAHDYNRSQNRYRVVPEFQGSYNEAVEKFLNTHGTKASPALYQSMDISTAQIAGSHYTVPVQKFVDRDHYQINQISPIARSFYSHNGKLLSMPFNVSQPVLYYNASLFKKYHVKALPLDPSYHDVGTAARQLYSRSHHHVKGLSVTPYGWLFEEFYANANAPFTDHANGHKGVPTRINYQSQVGVTTMRWLQKLSRQGVLINYGSGNNAFTNEIAGFMAGKVGMFLQSSSDLTQLEQGHHDQIGVCYYPHPDGQKANGVSIGGASLWIGNDKSARTQQGAWDFVKYLMKPSVQAEWQVKTGYLAINHQALRQTNLQNYLHRHPEAKVPLQQLNRTRPNNNNSGIYMDNLNQERTVTQGMMNHVYNGASVTHSLKSVEHQMDQSIRKTNHANLK